MGSRGGSLKLGQQKLAKSIGGSGGGGMSTVGGGSSAHGIAFTGGAGDPFSGAPGSGFGGGSAGGGSTAGYTGQGAGGAGAGGAGISGAGTATYHIEPNTTFGQDPNHHGYITFSSNSDAYHWHENNNFDQSKWDALDTFEKKGVKDYTSYHYAKINTVLRHEETPSPITQTQIDGAKSALAKSESASDVIVWRGANAHWTANLLKSDEKLSSDKLKNMNDHAILKDANYLKSCVGKTVTDRGFMSSAVTESDAWGADVVYKIYVPKGTHGMYVDPISVHKGEKEWLFNAGQQYIVQSITTGFDGEVTELVLEAIP